jgi:hypothetical protein
VKERKDDWSVRKMYEFIAKNALKLRPYKKQKVNGLTEAQKAARVQKYRQLLAWHASDDIIFSDKKLGIFNEKI